MQPNATRAGLPFVDSPLHPEYPCAHCIVSGAVGSVLVAELGSAPTPTLTYDQPDGARNHPQLDEH